MNDKFISRYWPLTNVSVTRILKQSGERIVYEVASNEGHFTLKIADASKDESTVEKDIQILRYLSNVSYPAPRLVTTNSGANFIHKSGKFIYILSFIEGTEPEMNIMDYAQLGYVTAKLHSLGGYTISTGFTAIDEIPKMVRRARRYNMESLYEVLVHELPDFEALPKCIIHTDIGAHNAIKQLSGEITLIDWDDAGIGTRILDIGFPLICDFVSKDLVFDKQRAQSFYSAYCSLIDLTVEEKNHLFDAAMFYALSYTIFDDSGIVEGQWKKVLFSIKNKDELMSVVPV